MSIYNIDDAIKRMVGRKITTVTLNKESNVVVFAFADGSRQTLGVEGDCCSSSWIEHIEAPKDIAGATLLSVEDSGTVDATSDDALNPKREPQYESDGNNREHECLRVYSTAFRTDRGEIVLEYRNSSNGYYGGYLTDEGWEGATSEVSP